MVSKIIHTYFKIYLYRSDFAWTLGQKLARPTAARALRCPKAFFPLGQAWTKKPPLDSVD
jgi:hypothetical protein